MYYKFEKFLSRKLIVLSILAAFTFLIYVNSFSSPFTLDDFGSISNNYSIRNPFDLAAIWKFYSNRFIIYLTFSINFFIHQTQVEGYHVVNFIIHVINGYLVFLILGTIFRLKQFEGGRIYKYSNFIALTGALIFLSHPVQINAVTYVVQRTAALAATFYFLSILLYMKYRLYGKIRYFVLMLLSILLAMFTKENTITIPFMLIFTELIFFLKDGTSWFKRLAVILLLLATVPVIPLTNVFLGGYSQSDPNVSFKASTNMDRFQYFYTQMNVIVHYIKDLLLPNYLNFDYSNDYPKSLNLWMNYSYLSLTLHVIIGLYALYNFNKNKLVAYGIFWFYLGLAVESTFISIKDVYFEHRLYFPIVGFILVIIGLFFPRTKIVMASSHSHFGINQRFISPHNKIKYKLFIKKPMNLFIAFMIFLILMYSTVTVLRNYIFSSNLRLWTDVTRKAPKSDRGFCVLGTNYLDLYKAKDPVRKTYLDKAQENFNRSLELNPNNTTARCNLSKVYLLKKEYRRCINEAGKVKNSKFAFYNAGAAYEGLEEYDNAIFSYKQGLKIDKKCTFILKSLGNLYYKLEDYQNSRYYYEEFLKYNVYPDNKVIKKKLKKIDELLKED